MTNDQTTLGRLAGESDSDETVDPDGEFIWGEQRDDSEPHAPAGGSGELKTHDSDETPPDDATGTAGDWQETTALSPDTGDRDGADSRADDAAYVTVTTGNDSDRRLLPKDIDWSRTRWEADDDTPTGVPFRVLLQLDEADLELDPETVQSAIEATRDCAEFYSRHYVGEDPDHEYDPRRHIDALPAIEGEEVTFTLREAAELKGALKQLARLVNRQGLSSFESPPDEDPPITANEARSTNKVIKRLEASVEAAADKAKVRILNNLEASPEAPAIRMEKDCLTEYLVGTGEGAVSISGSSDELRMGNSDREDLYTFWIEQCLKVESYTMRLVPVESVPAAERVSSEIDGTTVEALKSLPDLSLVSEAATEQSDGD